MLQKIVTRVAMALMLAASTLLTMAPVARAAKLTPEQQCQKGRYEAAAKYAACENKALAQLFATNDLGKLQPAVSKCRGKYTEIYLKLQKKAVGTGSTCDVQRFVETAGNTVVDNLTGLEWAKFTLVSSVTWDVASESVATLNDTDPPCFGGPTPTCFASHCDWRLPTIVELQTILLGPFPCTTSPCIAPVFGTPTADDYWSATTLADNADYAWGVFFGAGPVSAVSYGLKTITNAVRPVRGGL